MSDPSQIDPRLWHPPKKALVLPWSLTREWHGQLVTVIGAPVYCHVRMITPPYFARECWNCAVYPPTMNEAQLTPDGGNYAVEANALLVIDGHDPDAGMKSSWRRPRRILRLKNKPEIV